MLELNRKMDLIITQQNSTTKSQIKTENSVEDLTITVENTVQQTTKTHKTLNI